MVVILGTAHGSNVAGKRSPDGKLLEYKWSREFCKKLKQALINKGINTIIDIEDDREISISNRVKIVNDICRKNNKDCIYISVHIDAAGNGTSWYNASGLTIRVGTKASNNSKKLALSLYNAAKDKNVFGNRCIPPTKYYVQKLYVCNETICPAVLVENMFQDNKKDVEFLLSKEGQEKLLNIYIEGITNYLKINR